MARKEIVVRHTINRRVDYNASFVEGMAQVALFNRDTLKTLGSTLRNPTLLTGDFGNYLAARLVVQENLDGAALLKAVAALDQPRFPGEGGIK